jgi:predicted DNA-binding protein (MmcQ/YjbR family)
MKNASPLTHMRAICLALPDTKETLTWGQPHFRVGDKIFAGCGDEKGRCVIGFKLDMDHADAMVQDPRFRRAPYVGHKGWVSIDAAAVDDWEEMRPLVIESYRLIAPKKTLARWVAAAAAEPAAPGARRKAKRKTQSKTPAVRPRKPAPRRKGVRK